MMTSSPSFRTMRVNFVAETVPKARSKVVNSFVPFFLTSNFALAPPSPPNSPQGLGSRSVQKSTHHDFWGHNPQSS